MARKRDLGGGFQIIGKTDSTTHGGYVTGTLNLNNLSAVLIDEDEATIDIGAIHGKSRAERGIKFLNDPASIDEEMPNPKTYYIVWVAVDWKDGGPYYAGIADCTVQVDRAAKRGFKNMAEHVNQMDAALKKKVRIKYLDDRAKRALKQLLKSNNEKMWENTPEETKQQLV